MQLEIIHIVASINKLINVQYLWIGIEMHVSIESKTNRIVSFIIILSVERRVF